MYEFYFDNMLFPVAPAKLEVQHKGRNKTIDLINDGEVNILKKEGLQEASIDFLLPAKVYPFAKYLDGFHPPLWYVNYLHMYKFNKQPFNFIVSRVGAEYDLLNYSIMRCTLEDYTVIEDAEESLDWYVNVKIKEWKSYCTKLFTLNRDGTITPYGQDRDTQDRIRNSPRYKVKNGDCLWAIAKTHYGDGGAYEKIMAANGMTGNPNHAIYPGQEIFLPQ